MANRQNPLYWSFGLGTWFGVRIRISWLMPLLLAWCLFEFGARLGGTVFGLLMTSVLLHEIGHILAARAMDGSGDEILIWPLGGLAYVDGTTSSRTQFVSAIGGPLVNLLLCGMFLPAVLAGGRAAQAMNPLTLPVTPEQFAAASVTYQLPILAFWLNWLLLAINLLPVYPLDGGQVLRSWLVSRFGATMAGEAAVRVAFVAGGVLALVALLVFKHVILMAIAFLILLLALQESFHLQSSESFDDSFMGYDFSQGYTSLERSDRKKPERQSGLLARWLEMRRAEKQRRLDRQREQVDQQLDGILAKVHECGLGALTPAERRLLKRASERFRSKDQDPT